MVRIITRTARRIAAPALVVALAAGCHEASTAPSAEAQAVATLRAATARHQSLDAAIADGFVFLHGCETRGNEAPVGMLYVHMERLTDGRIDPALPDALIYEPSPDGGAPTLVGVELAVPYAQWTEAARPTFLGATFQREDEFGVFGLHVWVWRSNPNGLFAESHPHVSCGA